MRRTRLLLLGWLALCSGCTIPTSVLLEIRAASGMIIDELRLTVFDDIGSPINGRRLPATGAPHLPDQVALFPRNGAGTLRVIVRALNLGQRIGEGATLAATRPGAQVTATLTVEPGLLPDGDGDGVPDVIDNCPQQVNPQQDSCLPAPDASVDLIVTERGPDLPADRSGGERRGDGPAGGDRSPTDALAEQPADGAPTDQAAGETAPAVLISAPKGGEVWATGTSRTISWTSSAAVSSVTIELWKASVKDQTIATGQPASGSYTWTVPAITQPTSFRIRVVDPQNTSLVAFSPAFTITPWQRYRAVTIQNSGTQALTDYPVGISLDPASFDFSKARSDGGDVRIATQAGAVTFNVSYWIETWKSTGATVWALVPQLAAGQTITLYLFYGNAGATTTGSSTATFPKRWVSTGSVTLSGTQSYDWFELQTGHTLKLTAAQPLIVNARRIVIAGMIDGKGLGYAGGDVGVKGSGPGGGGVSAMAGAAGGGYGGAGGAGGYDAGDTVAAGGPANGNATDAVIAMGSGGGGGSLAAGGGGGGAVTLTARSVLVTGTINLAGGAGVTAPQCSGGGAGGGLLVQSYEASLAAALVDLSGGAGGNMTATNNDGGGGGGGGRYKAFTEKTYAAPGTLKLTGGAGGTGGAAAAGKAGGVGTGNATTKSFGDPATVTVGAETTL